MFSILHTEKLFLQKRSVKKDKKEIKGRLKFILKNALVINYFINDIMICTILVLKSVFLFKIYFNFFFFTSLCVYATLPIKN